MLCCAQTSGKKLLKKCNSRRPQKNIIKMGAQQTYMEENALLLLLGADVAARQSLYSHLREQLQKQISLCTSSIALDAAMQILRQYRSFAEIQPAFIELEKLFAFIYSVEHRDLQIIWKLQQQHNLTNAQATHLMLLQRHQITNLIAPTSPYTRIAADIHLFAL